MTLFSQHWRRERGFTFVEVMAALVFLGILVPAILQGLTIANRASVISDRSAIAGELAENKLNELLINNTWQTATDSQGDFGADWPGYRWELSQATWDQDTVNTMTELTVQVIFSVQGQERNVALSTLVSSSTQTQTSS